MLPGSSLFDCWHVGQRAAKGDGIYNFIEFFCCYGTFLLPAAYLEFFGQLD